MLTTMPDLAWNVHVSSWNWVYTFSHKGTVSWKDPLNKMTGRGTWRIEGGELVIRWHGSKTLEKWVVPIDPKAATGKCFMQEGTFDLTAEAINFFELDPVVIFARTPESKAKFLQSCADAVHDVQIAQLAFRVWLMGMAITYGQAFETHKKFLDDLAGTKNSRKNYFWDLLSRS